MHKEIKKQLKALAKLDDYRQTESFAELEELMGDVIIPHTYIVNTDFCSSVGWSCSSKDMHQNNNY